MHQFRSSENSSSDIFDLIQAYQLDTLDRSRSPWVAFKCKHPHVWCVVCTC